MLHILHEVQHVCSVMGAASSSNRNTHCVGNVKRDRDLDLQAHRGSLSRGCQGRRRCAQNSPLIFCAWELFSWVRRLATTTTPNYTHTTANMPKSKRAKVVHLTKTDKKGKELSQKLFANVQEAADSFEHIFVFAVENMRNSYLKQVRAEFSDSRYVSLLRPACRSL
jgi:hypothetical protein